MTTLLVAVAGFLVGRWLREEWECWQTRQLLAAFPPPRIVSSEAPSAAELCAGIGSRL